MKIVFLIFLMTPHLSFADAVPTGISTNQVKHISKKFLGLLSLNASNSPFALGQDFEIEITTVYQDLRLNNINDIGAISNKSIFEPMASIKKGLYWNLDVGFTFILPIESQLLSGYAFNLNHSAKLGSFYIKPEIFISNYNLNDRLNLSSSGLSIVTFRKISFFYLGLGLRTDFVTGIYEKQFLSNNTLMSNNAHKASFISTSGVIKLAFKPSNIRLTATYSFLDAYKSESSISLSFKL